MEPMLDGYETFLSKLPKNDSFYESAIQELKQQDGTLSVDLQIADATERLQQLKFHFIEVVTKELFVEKIAQGATHAFTATTDVAANLPCPSMQELASLELAAEHQKAALKRVKRARVDAAARLQEACGAVGERAAEDAAARATFSRTVEDGVAGLRLRQVTEALGRRDEGEIAALAERVDGLGAKACERIMTYIFDDLSAATQRKERAEKEVKDLRARADAQVQQQAALNTQIAHFRTRIERHERENEDASRKREESMWHENLYAALKAITRTSGLTVSADGIRVDMLVNRPKRARVKVEEGDSDVHATSEQTYTLELDVSDNSGENVTCVRLSPPDVDTSKVASARRPRTVVQAVWEVVDRLSSTPS